MRQHLLTSSLILIAVLPISCRKVAPDSLPVANVTINELALASYTTYEADLVPCNQGATAIGATTMKKGAVPASLTIAAAPGQYQLNVRYFTDTGNITYSTDNCSGQNKNNTVMLVAGVNAFTIRVCVNSNQPGISGPATADVIVGPTAATGSTTSSNNINNVQQQSPSTTYTAGSKKGLGMWGSSGSLAVNVGAKWFYNWKPNNWAGSTNGVEFVPMIWSTRDVTDQNINALKTSGYTNLLGFNEPDHGDQANMSVSEAIALWPRLMETGLRLGSPAPASWKNWLPDFMKQATAKNYRVDFIAIHMYPKISDANAVQNLQQELTEIYQTYNKPIWLTEFGACNFSGSYQQSDIDKFMAAAIPMLNSLPFVERYSWFADLSYGGCPMTAVFSDSSGSLSTTGTDYKNAQ